jgi:hypothetical protein
VRVTKPFAIFGFHFCTTIFIGLSLYGVVRYVNEGLLQSDSLLAAGSYAAVILASIAGIGFFGREADRRKNEEVKKSPPAAPASPKKRKR